MTEEEKYTKVQQCVDEIALAEAENKKIDAFIKKRRADMVSYLKLNTNSPLNEKLEYGKFKVSIVLNPTVSIDEKKLETFNWSSYTKVIKTKHEISGAVWRDLPDKAKKELSTVVEVKYNSPSIKIEEKGEEK